MQMKVAAMNTPETPKVSKLHILIGNEDDLESAAKAFELDEAIVSWVVPKAAIPDDDVLIYFRNINAIFGTGRIVTNPLPSVFRDRKVYRADIELGPPLDPMLSLDELAELLPDWAWTRYPRTYTTPSNEVANVLLEIAKNRWVEENHLHEDLSDVATYAEGALTKVLVNRYERDGAAREKCLEHHGYACGICGFDFGKQYGEDLDGFIHVHHIRPLADIDAEYQVNPITDLLPVCPNCHAVIHSKRVARTPEDVKKMLSDMQTALEMQR